MQLEFHQLDRRWEHLRVRQPTQQRRLLASLAEAGQQTPIVVVAAAGRPDRYVVIDGYKRIAALGQLGRDTVEAVVWPMDEAPALLLDRSQRFSQQETALEQGWLLSELEEHFGYSLDELARRFDRSVSWVSRRLALVELLPAAIQEQVRQGQIRAQVAMKFLVPVARVSVEDCERMAAALARHRCDTRQAGQLYRAWREGSAVVRQRLLDHPELFFKTQRPAPQPTPAPGSGLLRDLEMAAAILTRATRQLAGAAAMEIDPNQRQAARQQIERIQSQLRRLAEKLPQEEQRHVEPIETDGNSGTAPTGSELARDRAGAENLPPGGAQSAAVERRPSAGDTPCGESRAVPATDSGADRRLQGESGASP